MGTPEYAAIILEGLAARSDVLLRVVTKPDVPVGRKQILTPSTVARRAETLGLFVDKPWRLGDFQEKWRSYAPDLIVTAAYGRLLPGWLLALPVRGAYNLHASLLPRWRGANPIAWAIRAGDRETGVTLMAMDEGMDTGPIVSHAAIPILPHDTTGSLTVRLARLARDLLMDQWPRLVSGPPPLTPQPGDGMTLAPKFRPEDAHIDWSLSATAIERLIRSMTPEPGAYTMADGIRIKILSAHPEAGTLAPGWAVAEGKDRWKVGTGEGVLIVQEVQPAGRRPMSAGDFLRGRRLMDAGMLLQ